MSNFLETYSRGLYRRSKYINVGQDNVDIIYEPDQDPGNLRREDAYTDTILNVDNTQPAGKKVRLTYDVGAFYDEPFVNFKDKAIELWGNQLKSLSDGIHPAEFNLYFMYGTIDSEYGVTDYSAEGFVSVSRFKGRNYLFSEAEMYERTKNDALKKNVGQTYTCNINGVYTIDSISADSTMAQNGNNHLTEYTYDDTTSMPANTIYQSAPIIDIEGGMFEFGCNLTYRDIHNYTINYSCKVAADSDGNKYLTDITYKLTETSKYKEFRISPKIKRVGPVSGDYQKVVPIDISYRTDQFDPVINNWTEVESLAQQGGSSAFDGETYFCYAHIYDWE